MTLRYPKNGEIWRARRNAFVTYWAFGKGHSGVLFEGRGRILVGQEIGILHPAEKIVPEPASVKAVPAPEVDFDRLWIPEGVRRDPVYDGHFLLEITTAQLNSDFEWHRNAA